MKPNEAFPSLFRELRAVAERLLAQERASHTLQPTALVNEAYVRCAGGNPDMTFADRQHFLRAVTEMMNHVLIDHARGRKRLKRGGAAQRLGLHEVDDPTAPTDKKFDDDDILTLNDALAKLEGEDPQVAAVVRLRVFGGTEMAQIARVLGVSERTVYNDWATAKVKLRKLLADDPTD